MAIDFKNFLNVVPHVAAAKFPVLMRGRHGIGKSQVVYQLAESLNRPLGDRDWETLRKFLKSIAIYIYLLFRAKVYRGPFPHRTYKIGHKVIKSRST